MTEPARGIHDHPVRKLGKRAPIPSRRAVAFADFVTAVPEHPAADVAPNLSYPMDRNDVAGDCVVAGADHALQVICAALGVKRSNWSDQQILAFYQTQNPQFRTWDDGNTNADGGMVIQYFLEYLVAQGVILAFGRIDHTDPEQMRAAAYLGLGTVLGVSLQTAQQTQKVWDYTPSGDWGGHCIAEVGYPSSQRETCVTWGELVDFSEAFRAKQADEAWFLLHRAHVDHPSFRAHFDLPAFAKAVSDMTGGKVVVPVTPPPTPAPLPTSVAFTPAQHAALDAWAVQPHVWSKATAAAKAWKDATR